MRFFDRLNIGNKLALILIAFALFLIALVASLLLVQFEAALKERILLQLSSVKQLNITRIKESLTDQMQHFESVIAAADSGEVAHTFDWITTQNNLDSIYQLPVNLLPFTRDTFPVMVDITPFVSDRQITIAMIGKANDRYVVAVTKVPEIQEILLERTGLGETGETYLVGEDYLLRTISRFDTLQPDDITVRSEGVKRALEGKPGQDVFEDYRGKEVFSTYEKIEIHGLTWVILSEIDMQEAIFPLIKLKTNLLYLLLVIIIFALVISYFLSRILIRPLIIMEKKLMAMSKGEFSPGELVVGRNDEIGQMFQALDKLVLALSDTIVFAGKIGGGDFHAHYQPLSQNDKLGEALLTMRDKLLAYQQNEERLLKENQRSMVSGEEKERSRLSKELHDGLGPLLTTLRLNVQTAALEETLKSKLLHRLDETIQEVRKISNNLMPSVLCDFGAGEAIGNLIEQMREHLPIEIFYKNDMSSEGEISDDIHIALYRIAQESLNNAIKHANATVIKVSVTEFEDHLSYFIADNGIGFELDSATKGNGLRNMRERIKIANGTIHINSSSEGTTIEAEIPIP